MRLLLAFVICLLAIPAQASDVIVIEKASTFVRPSSIPTAGIFMIIENKGSEADRLVGVKTAVAGKASLHTMDIDEKGTMYMREVDGFDIPADKSTPLAPGGNHVMLMDIKEEFAKDTTIPLTLVFEKSGEMAVAVDVITPEKMSFRFPPTLTSDVVEKMMEKKKAMGLKDETKSSLDILREKIQKFFRKEKKTESHDPSNLITREEMERREAMEPKPVLPENP